MARNSENPRQENLFIFLQSEHQYSHEAAFRRVEAEIWYSQQDWEALVHDAEKIGYPPERLLEKRLKLTIHTGNPTSRIAHAADRRRFMEGHASFWEPFVRYLIYSHISVIVAGAIIEFLFGYGREYILFYWIYLASLMIALVALLGLKLKGFMETEDRPYVPDSVNRTEIGIARISEFLIWTSLVIFVSSVLVRIGIGIHRAAVYLQST
jgi:hypothetical protein